MNATPQFGPLTVRIFGKHPAAEIAAQEIGTATEGPTHVDASFDLNPSRKRLIQGGASGGRLMLRHRVLPKGDTTIVESRLRGAGFLYRAHLPPDLLVGEATSINIELPTWSSKTSIAALADPVVRRGTRDYLNLHELIAKNFIYEILDPIMLLRLQRSGNTLMHASGVVDPDGHALLMTGTGGVGKSTTLLSLMSRPDLRYLGDDMVLVGADGSARRHPKHMQVYAYNLIAFPEWKQRIFAGMPQQQRNWWVVREKLFGPKKVRRRISAVDLFGRHRVADEATIRSVAWISRGTSRNGAIRQIDADAMTQLCTAALLDELWDFFQLLNISGVVGRSNTFLTDIARRAQETLVSALSNVDCFVVEVPEGREDVLTPQVSRILNGD